MKVLKRLSFQGRLGASSFILKGSEKPKDESLKASASFILRKTRRFIFHFEGSGTPKDESLKAAASFILRARAVIFHFEESGKPKDESLKASASFILRKARSHLSF